MGPLNISYHVHPHEESPSSLTHQNPAAERVVGGKGEEGALVEHPPDLGVVVAEAPVVEGVLLAVAVEQQQLPLCLLHVVLGPPET